MSSTSKAPTFLEVFQNLPTKLSRSYGRISIFTKRKSRVHFGFQFTKLKYLIFNRYYKHF